MKTGIYQGIPNSTYHAGDEISKSALDKVAISPAHYLHHKQTKQEPTQAMNIGTAFHALVLEPDTFDACIAIAPECDRRTTTGKALYAEFMQTSTWKTVISSDEFDDIQRMRDAVMSHPSASLLLSGGIAEQSAYWVDDETGLACRCRPDYQKSSVLVDLKSTLDASPLGFGRSAAKLRYHVQAAFYLDGYNAACGGADEFVFVAVEKSAPYNVAVYVCDDFVIEKGRELYRKDLESVKEAKESGIYKGYGDDPMPLWLPEWAIGD